jgi:hypothetical protein
MIRRPLGTRAGRRLRPAGAVAGLAALCAMLTACAEDAVGPAATAASRVPATTPAATGATPPATAAVAPAPRTTPAAPGAATDPEPVDRPAGFPATGEAFLLTRLDRDVARRCTRRPGAELSAGAIAGVDCAAPSADGVRSSYELFRTRVAMEVAYGRIRAANGVPVARGQCVPPGGGGRVPGDAPWGYGAGAPGQGRVMCFRDGGEVRFVTSIEALNVLAFASAERFGAADRFWRTVGLPSPRP